MQAAQQYVSPKKSYKGKINEVVDATFYPLGCYVNGRYDVEVGYLLVTRGDEKDLEKLNCKIGDYCKYIKVNFDGKQFAEIEKFSESISVEEEISKLKKLRIDVNITPKYTYLKDNSVCRDFVAKGIYVERRAVSFEISASHMQNTFNYAYGEFYFANAASFQNYKINPGMKNEISRIVESGENYFVCDVYGDEEKGRSLVLRGVLLGDKDLMFIKQPSENERRWEHIFIIFQTIDKFCSLSFFTTDSPSKFTPSSIADLILRFYEKKPISKENDPIIFSTR